MKSSVVYILKFLSVLVVTFTMTACGGGSVGTGGSTATSVFPNFSGIIFSTANNSDAITVAWVEATDDATVPQNMLYKVYASLDANFIPSDGTLVKEVIGETQTVITGLNSGSTYYLLVIAEDEDGNKNLVNNYVLETTTLNPVVLNSATPLENAQDLGLGTPAVSGTQYSYAYTGTESLPAAGSILIGEDATGGYLVKVVSASIAGSEIVVQTTSGSLSEAVEQGGISSTVTLFDVPGTTSQSVAAGLAEEASSAKYGDTRTIEWSNKLLKVEQTNYNSTQEGMTIDRDQASGHYIIKSPQQNTIGGTHAALTGSATEELVYDVAIDPDLKLKTDLDWGFDLIDGFKVYSGEIVAQGVMSVDAKAIYNFKAAGSFTKDYSFDVFTKTYTAKYMVGGVPVWQDITFTLKANLTADATAEINANAHANITDTIEFGVKYNPLTKEWEPVSANNHSETLTADLSVKGGVNSQIRLIPNIEVKFYKVVAADLSFEPFVASNIEAEAVMNADFLAGYFPPGVMQVTVLDAYLQAECFVGANLTRIVPTITLLSKTNVCTTPKYTFFSLPKIDLTSSDQGNGEYLLTAGITDGINNPFDDSSIGWYVYPKDAGTLVKSGRQATFTVNDTTTIPKITIFFSGYGTLGEVGRQFAQVDIQNTNFDGTYTYSGYLLGKYLHTEKNIVSGNSITGYHRFSGEGWVGTWSWTGTVTVAADPPDGSVGIVTGSGIRSDTDPSGNTFNQSFTLDSGSIDLNADGSADMYWQATDYYTHGVFGGASHRPAQ